MRSTLAVLLIGIGFTPRIGGADADIRKIEPGARSVTQWKPSKSQLWRLSSGSLSRLANYFAREGRYPESLDDVRALLGAGRDRLEHGDREPGARLSIQVSGATIPNGASAAGPRPRQWRLEFHTSDGFHLSIACRTRDGDDNSSVPVCTASQLADTAK